MLPLAGKKVLVTRGQELAQKFTEKLLANGATVYEVPLLKITCKNSLNDVHMVKNSQWIFFTSVNGVKCFFSLIKQYNITLPSVNFVVVGQKTEKVLQQYGYKATFTPSIYDGENLVKEFLEKYAGVKNVLLVQGNRSRDVIAKGLSEAGVSFQTLVVYETLYNTDEKYRLQQVLNEVEFDFLTFTSPSTIEAFAKFANKTFSDRTKIVCIGNTTLKRAKQLGFKQVVCPDTYTIEGMIQVMCEE